MVIEAVLLGLVGLAMAAYGWMNESDGRRMRMAPPRRVREVRLPNCRGSVVEGRSRAL